MYKSLLIPLSYGAPGVWIYNISTNATSQSPSKEMDSGGFTLKLATVFEGNVLKQLLLGKVKKNPFDLCISTVCTQLSNKV